MGNEITSVGQYNSVGAAGLAKYGKDANGDHEVDYKEANKNTLTFGDFRKIAKAGGDNPDTISYLDVLTYEGYKISQAVLDQVRLIPEMVSIPAGKFNMGSTDRYNEKPVRKVIIPAFRMGRYEATNAEYKAYLEANGRQGPYGAAEVADPAKARHPVVYVSWNDAVDYCKWLSGKTGRKFRLPTEAEWEYAARGTAGRKYPWGKELDVSKAVFDTDGTKPVGSRPEGASPFGVMDMAGNVWEWVNDRYADKYNPGELNNPKGPKKGDDKVLRGCSWYDSLSDCLRGAFRSYLRPGNLFGNHGFRVAEDF